MNSKKHFLLSFLMALTVLTTTAHGEVDIAVYWGQKGSETSLRDTCLTEKFSHVMIAFLDHFGFNQTPHLNLSGHPNTSIIGEDIKFCQNKNVQVLLSIGGFAGNYGLNSTHEARDFFQYLYDNFLGGTSDSRPFGDAVLNGIDFFIKQGSSAHYGDLAYALSLSKPRAYLSAAPQCGWPDPFLSEAIIDTESFDYVWVQFYNDTSCGYREGVTSDLIDSWNKWSGRLPYGKLYLGLPADAHAVESGYIPVYVLESKVLPIVQNSSNYGGLAIWDKYWDKKNCYTGRLLGKVCETRKSLALKVASMLYDYA